ncbi:transcription factor TFIIIB component B'' homolog isoform X4 [Mugil cephalus]|uniref:transcription factor TFIIIB component B'' homolog isoform X4 n=1 Tax=Mugil cephalus TaxID=48193 RepID=UPI001FB56E77|nr:transcription factor TFIIIB component B'' homolog isoform X4 [Mugil cephalus]
MFRRSRFSVRPNVGTGGRAAAASQEAPSASQEAGETPQDAGESNSTAAAAVTENKTDLTTTEKAPAPGDGGDQTGEGTSASAAVQRRKRFSIKPKVAPGRAALARAAKSPGKALAETPGSGADFDKPTTSNQTTAAPQGLQSPRRRRPSEETKQPTIQTKPSTISSESSELSSVPLAEESPAETCLPGDGSKDLENISVVKVKEVPPRQPEVPPSLPDKEAIEISEKAKTLVSTKSLLSQTSSAFTLSRLLNDPSDLQRLAKAQKLRELLRKEMCKEKKLKKVKMFPKEYTLDPAKMTMSDLIRYLPTSNPMTTSLEDSTQENETVVPPSPVREESPERAQEPEAQPSTVNSREDGEEEAEEDEDDSLLVPQVKVAEDGSLIIDEESLTVEVQRAKGPNPVHNRDPIFERGSTTTYSSFRKGTYSKPWSSEETDMFFLAINMVGTDFSMICQLFPHRARSEIKNKFKKEERENAWRIDKAFRERRKLDIEYFSKLLEKILEYQKNKKKLKSLTQKNSPKKNKKKEKAGKKSAKKGLDEQEGGEVNENQVPDLEKEGEKENEELCNEGETPDSKPKRKRKTKNKPDALTEEPDGKKKKTDEKSNEQGEAGIPEDAEAALPEDHTNSDMSENIQQQDNTDKDASIKPAKLSRGRAPKPLLPLGRKWGKKHPPSTGEARDAPSDKRDESVSDGVPEEQAQDASPLSQANTKKSSGDDISSEEEDATIKPLRPTRYGRVPKPTRPLNYPSKEDAHSSASETVPASPMGFTAPPAKLKPKVTAKRAMASKAQSTPKSKKPKLVTLRASQSESSDDDIETPWLNEELVVEEQQLEGSPGKDSSAPAFVPASLHTPQPVISEVDETMVELDILASMPDVLGMSQDALCPNSSCEEAHEADTAVPCEHQLDLLVDVIDFLSSEHTEVAEDESYNEAAQTLLTIGNLAHLPQSAQNQTAVQDDGTATTSASVDEPSHLEEEIASKPVAQEGCDTTSVSVAVGQEVTETSVASVEVQDAIDKCDDIPIINKSDPKCDEQKTVCDPTPQLHSEPESLNKDSPQAKKGRLSKVKPKPNLSRSSRTAQTKSLPETSAVRTPEENHSSAPSHSQPSDILSIGEERASKIPDCAPALFKDDISCAAKLTDVPSDSQRRLFDQAGSDVATADEKSSEIHSVCLSESHFDSSRDQVSRDTKPASESLDERQNSCVGTAETGFSSPETSVSADIEFRQGSSSDPVPVQESCNKPPPIEDLSLSQVGKNEAGTAFQSRRARLPKGRPKPNLPQTSRTVRSKPPSSAEEDSGSTSSPKSHKESITEVEPQPTCTPTLEKENEITDPAASVSNASLNLDSTLIPTVEASTNEEKTTCVELGNQVELGATTFENQELPKALFEASQEQATKDTGSTSECTDENLTSHTETISKDLVTTVSAITEPQDGQGSNVVSGPVQEVREQPAVFVKPVEKLTEEGESTSACQPTRRRSQKVKPKPNLSQTTRTTRSKPPTTTETTVEKHSVPAPNSQFHKETITEVEPQSTCSPTPVKESECPNRLLNLDSSHASTEEAHTNEEKTAHVVPDDQAEVGMSEKPSRELATGDTGPSHVETISNNVETTDSAVTESQVGDGPNVDPVQEASPSGHPAVGVKPVEELTVRLEEGERASACQLRRSRLQKPKPNLPLTKRTPRFKPQSPNDQDVENLPSPTSAPESTDNALAEVKAQPTSDTTPLDKSSPASVSVPSLDICPTHQCTKELPSTEGLNTDVGCEQASSSVDSEQNVPQKMRWFPKVKPKPNVGSSTRTKMQSGDTSKPSEQKETTSNAAAGKKVVDSSIAQTDLELKEKNAKHLTAAHCSSDAELSSINVGPVDSEKLLDSTNDKSVALGVVIASGVPEKQPMLTDSLHKSKSTNKSTVETKSTEDKMSKKYPDEVSSSSQGDNKLDTSTTESHTQQISDPTPASDVESSKDGSTESNINSTLTTTENPVCLDKDSSVQSSETESELTDSKTSRKAPQARRGRLIKPKPNLGRAGRPSQPRKMQNTTAEAESSSCSQGVDASVDHKPMPDIHQPVGKVTGEHGNQDSPVSDVGSSLGCMPQVTKHQNEHDSRSNDGQASLECVTQVSSTQSESPSSKEGIQSFPVLFQEMLPDQVPSDPNEPFFILSLTEIPVSSSGEDASIQPPSVSGESFAAGDGPFFYVSTEDGNMMDLISVKDMEATSTVSPMEHPLDPHGSVTVQPPQTADNDENTKQRRAGPGRTGKLQDKTKPARKKQTDKMETAEEGGSVTANSTQEPDVGTNKTGPDPETSSGARTTQRTGTSVWNKKPKDFPSFLSETNAAPSNNPPLSSNAASTQSKVKTQPAESSSEPVAFVSRAVGPEPGLTNPPTETKAEVDMEETSDHGHSTSDQVPSTSQGPTEKSDRVEKSSVEEEPTNVSQYFLSDIFTEVDEG